MPSHKGPARTAFKAKTWIFWAQAIVFGVLGAFAMTMGPLLLMSVIVPAHGGSDDGAGIALSIFGVIFLAVFMLAIFNIAARKKPIILLVDGAVEVNLVGTSTLDGIPLVPGFGRVAWSIISGQGFRRSTIRVPCDRVTDVAVRGLPMGKVLILQFEEVTDDGDYVLHEVRIGAAALRQKIDSVAEAILDHCVSGRCDPTDSSET